MKKIAYIIICLGFPIFALDEIENKLQSMLPQGVALNFYEDSEIKDFYVLNVANNQIVYISKDFKYIFAGEVIKSSSDGLESVNELYKRKLILNLLSQVPENELIKFISENEKYLIHIFTDVTCAYCRIFHSEIEDYLAKGISVAYLAFPRDGTEGDSAKNMEYAWCSPDRNTAITKLKFGEDIDEYDCQNPVNKHYEIGRMIGITGTPSIILSNGQMLSGYIPAEDLFKIIENG